MNVRTAARHDYGSYFTQHEEFDVSRSAGGRDRVAELRAAGIAAFRDLGLPTATRGNEDWRFSSVTPIANSAFGHSSGAAATRTSLETVKELVPWDETWTTLVFVDGRLEHELAIPAGPDQPVVTNLLSHGAASDGRVDVELGRHASPDSNGFLALNSAFLDDGAVVLAGQGARGVVHLVFASSDNSEPQVTYPRSLVVAGPNSELTLLESYVGISEGGYFTNSVTEITLKEGARVSHYRYLHESPGAFHIGSTRVSQGRDSTFGTTSFSRGCRVGRNDVLVRLLEEGAECDLRGLYFTDGRQHVDNHINVDHISGHTSSAQYFKGILTDRSRAVFSGTTRIQKNAQKSAATQADKNLILSEGARVNTKPSLVIFADDVQATHGATAGAIPDEQVYYMLSRGLDLEEVTSFLIKGFANEIIDGIGLDPFRDYLESYFETSVPRYRFEGFGKARAFGGPAQRVA
jgi:Fe-S cluster assembly protein SufD